jgi:hypothetical protein
LVPDRKFIALWPVQFCSVFRALEHFVFFKILCCSRLSFC